MAVRSYTDGAGTEWTVWDVRPQAGERRAGMERRSGRDRRAGATPGGAVVRQDRRLVRDRRATVERRLTPRSRVAIFPGLEQGWLCFEGGGTRRRLAPIPSDWEACDVRTLEAYRQQASLTRPSIRSA